MNSSRSAATLINLATIVLVVVALYLGEPLLMPLAVATLVTFLLNPVVNALCRMGLRLPFSVALVVILGFSIFGMMLWGFGSQVTSLAADLPNYKQNIREKILDLRSAGNGSALERVRQTWRELRGEIKQIDGDNKAKAAAARAAHAGPVVTNDAAPLEPEPVPVVVRSQGNENMWSIPTALGPVADIAATAALVLILVIFMLLRGRELRNRLIVFFGQHRIPTTTRALDEAAERISRYLLMQTIINSTYGLAVGIALYFLGLPYALMWGFLAALLRFIPYVGPVIGAGMPILLSLAVFPGWLHPLLVLGLILILELISNMFMEPMLYGPTVGVSEVALIIAVAFWTWIWGPMGLALATPLTVCLVVLGKYVPSLSFLPLLMGDDQVMSPAVQYYQRLLAMDEAEATEIAKKFEAQHEKIELYDQLLMPALLTAKRDVKNQELSDEHLDFIMDVVEKLIARGEKGASELSPVTQAIPALGIPAEDSIDELILRMLCQVMPDAVQLKSVPPQILSGEMMEIVEQNRPAVVCIGAGLPGGTENTRHLAKRLKMKVPMLPVVLARWGLVHPKRKQELAASTGIANIATTLKEARNYLVQFAQLTQPAAIVAGEVEPEGTDYTVA